MFDTLVESGSHSDDLARKGSFFLGTMVLYAVVLLGVAVLSIYLYNDSIPDPSLELLTLVAPVPMAQDDTPKAAEEPKPAAKAEPTVAMVKDMAVIAPVTKTNEVAPPTAKVVPTNKTLNVLVGDRDVGDVNAVPTGPVGVVGGTGGGGAGTGGAPKVEVSDEPPPPPPAPTPPPKPKTVVSGGVLNGKAISKPQPAYPPIAKAARASGTVTVQILVDESGRVVSASAVSGHPLLQQAAVSAARQARFSPTLLSGQPVKVSGVITYNFTTAPASAEGQRRRQLLSRLHPSVAAVVERLLEGRETPGEAEAKFVRDGKAELRIWLTVKSPAVLTQLEELGFELILDAPSSGLLVGRLPIDKLPALADLQAVRFVAPEESQK
jgi:protein TonB